LGSLATLHELSLGQNGCKKLVELPVRAGRWDQMFAKVLYSLGFKCERCQVLRKFVSDFAYPMEHFVKALGVKAQYQSEIYTGGKTSKRSISFEKLIFDLFISDELSLDCGQ